jgi:excisionase family DNA binding protein
MAEPLDHLLTADEVCAILRITRRTLQRWIHGNPPKLPYVQLSLNKIGFRRQTIEQFIRSREVGRDLLALWSKRNP